MADNTPDDDDDNDDDDDDDPPPYNLQPLFLNTHYKNYTKEYAINFPSSLIASPTEKSPVPI